MERIFQQSGSFVLIIFFPLFIFCLYPYNVFAENVSTTYNFTKTISRANAESEYVMNPKKIAIDSMNNVYITGYFLGANVDFDPSEAEDLQSSYDNNTDTLFLTKINADGTYGYTKVFNGGGGDFYSHGEGIAIDSDDNMYITGYFGASEGVLADFDPGEGEDLFSHQGDQEIFLTKINADGTYGYTKTFTGGYSSVGKSIILDSSDNIYITGYFNGTDVDFDPGVGTDMKSSGGFQNFFLTKINADGTYGYTKTFSGGDSSSGNSIFIDSLDNIYLTGFFSGIDKDFDPSIGTDLHTSSGAQEIFLTKINADGTYGYTKTFTGGNTSTGKQVFLDSSGNVYIAGYVSGENIDFDPGMGTDIYSVVGDSMFLTRLNSNDSYGYTKIFGGNSYLNAIYINTSGDVFLNGYFNGTDVDFDPSSGVDLHTNANDSDSFFLTKINADGTYGYTHTLISDYSVGAQVVEDSLDNLYVVGYFQGTDVDFDPGVGVDLHSSVGANNTLFLTKFSQTLIEEISHSVSRVSGSFLRNVFFQRPIDIVDVVASPKLESINIDTPKIKFKFLNNLKLGMIHPDVKELQKYLNTHGYILADTGPGSVGNETQKFGKLTLQALIKFQLAHKISPALGFLGPITRGVMNEE